MNTASASSKEAKKITLNLPEETLDKIDAMAKNTLLHSRGTVIQSMVDEVIEVRKTLTKTEQEMKSLNLKDQSSTYAALLNMSIAINDISRRLSKFDEKPSK